MWDLVFWVFTNVINVHSDWTIFSEIKTVACEEDDIITKQDAYTPQRRGYNSHASTSDIKVVVV